MKKIDDIAVEEFGIEILQMMENAGRSLALSVASMLSEQGEGGRPYQKVLVLAGNGGNGGGGAVLCKAFKQPRFQRLNNTGQESRVFYRTGNEAAHHSEGS